MAKFDTKNLYGATGYFEPGALLKFCESNRIAKVCVLGGRGTGKTIGALMYCLQNHINFLYTRRHITQAELVASKTLSPLKAVNRNLGTEYMAAKVGKSMWGVFHSEYDESGKLRVKPQGEALATWTAVAAAAGLKGFDGLDIKVWLCDEVVLDKNERPLTEEGAGLRSMYETVNRNREDDGAPPLLMLCLGNSDKLTNPVALEFGWVRPFMKMKKEGLTSYMPDKRTLLILMDDSPRKEKKRRQAMYEDGGRYAAMAVDNDFTDDSFSRHVFYPAKELQPIARVGDLLICLHKGTRKYYMTMQYQLKAKEYDTTPIGIEKFKRQNPNIVFAYWQEQVEFQDAMAEGLWQEYLHLG